jgi:hypothetical protein
VVIVPTGRPTPSIVGAPHLQLIRKVNEQLELIDDPAGSTGWLLSTALAEIVEQNRDQIRRALRSRSLRSPTRMTREWAGALPLSKVAISYFTYIYYGTAEGMLERLSTSEQAQVRQVVRELRGRTHFEAAFIAVWSRKIKCT